VNDLTNYTFDDRQVRMILPHRAPMLMVDRVLACPAALDSLHTIRQISVGDAMLPRGPGDIAFFPPTLTVEALAQSCGLLMNLRWLLAQGVDVAAFAAGSDAALGAISIPHSVLAETRMRQIRLVQAGDSLHMNVRITLQRGSMLRFSAQASCAAGICTELDVLLAFPDYMLHAAS